MLPAMRTVNVWFFLFIVNALCVSERDTGGTAIREHQQSSEKIRDCVVENWVFVLSYVVSAVNLSHFQTIIIAINIVCTWFDSKRLIENGMNLSVKWNLNIEYTHKCIE